MNHRTERRPDEYVNRRGSNNVNAKLTEEDVLEIRRARPAGYVGRLWHRKQGDAVPLAVLAERFGVTKSVISNIARRATWRHVP